MDTASFLETVLADEGHYCLLALRGSDNKRKQKFYPNRKQLLVAAKQFEESGYNVFFSVGTYQTPESREATNVSMMRSFFLDLDCVPGKDYPDQRTGLVALRQLCADMALPKPLVVNSGRGLHAYWPFKDAISVEDWLPLAHRIKSALQHRGFRMDMSVPADAARVLRVPGTKNFKTDPPCDCAVLMDSGTLLNDPYAFAGLFPNVATMFPQSAPTGPVERSAAMANLIASSSNSFKIILQRTVKGTGCAQLGRIVAEQATIDEPSWRAGLSVAQFCEDRDKAIHFISKGHPEYSPSITDEKAAAIKGPYLCSKFEEYNPGVCGDCPHFGKIKSPIVLGRHVVEATETAVEEPVPELVRQGITVHNIPKYPAPFFRGKNGGVFKNTVDENGDPIQIQVYHNDLYVTQRINDPDAGECVVMKLHLPKDEVREFTVPLTAISSSEECRKVLSANGVGVIKVQPLMEYAVTWVNHLQEESSANKARRQYGWIDDKGTGFVVGNMEIRAHEILHNPPSITTSQTFQYFEPKGTLEGSKRVMAFFDKPGMELHQYMIGIGFGSVLLHMLPIFGAGFHIFSKDSGFGKTTAMYAGASIWGYPKKLVLAANDTITTKMNRAELYRHLPLYIDELTNESGKQLSDLAYQLTHGEQRNRARSSANMERHRGEPWALLCGTSGNKSVWEGLGEYKNGAEAEMQRIMEMQVHQVLGLEKDETDELSRMVMENYGHFKVPYIQYICQNYDKVKQELIDTQRTIDHFTGMTSKNRFWSAKAACVVLGIRIAKRLGFLTFDIPKLVEWVTGMVKIAGQATLTSTTDAVEVLNNYFLENYNNVLRTKYRVDMNQVNESIIQPEATPRGAYVARYEYDVKKLYIVPKFFKEWCVKQQLHYGGIVEELKKPPTCGIMLNMRLGRGTHVDIPPMRVMVVKFESGGADYDGDA